MVWIDCSDFYHLGTASYVKNSENVYFGTVNRTIARNSGDGDQLNLGNIARLDGHGTGK